MPDPPGALTRLSDLPSMAEGAKYRSLDDAINAARIHAQKANFSYRVKDRNKKRAVVKCSGHSCPAYTRISLSKKHEQFVVIQEGMPISKDIKVKDVRSFFK